MCEVTMEEQEEREISDLEPQECPGSAAENGVMMVVNHSRVRPPFSVVLATVLYCAELVSAAVLCSMYHKTDDVIWMSFTIAFMLLPAVLIQLALTFIHRDLGRDRPLVLFLHLLLLGPVIRGDTHPSNTSFTFMARVPLSCMTSSQDNGTQRPRSCRPPIGPGWLRRRVSYPFRCVRRCVEALVVYFKAGKREEPYVTISRKISLKKGQRTPMELEIGQTERILATHRNAFKRTAVIQAFLGSTPQLTLQLYATVQEKYLLPARSSWPSRSGTTIYTTRCGCASAAYLCMILWRGLEIATRITALVLFSTALTHWVILVGMVNLLFFFFLPWVEFWAKKGSLTEGVENNFSKLGTTVVLCMFTLLYACINVFCWSAVQLDLSHRELIERKQQWDRLAMYYCGRFVENLLLITLWYFFKSDFYEYVCARRCWPSSC
ncbi:hypothetical protein L3Q82_020447 [Scortum barcoo]|uniref:Uncharacterized protein n=1 Tax=Scortum barcoo TaxID=214431 RepID=A0ACB8V7V7_9TELE|nr:hypothetical protein L3Q82_020447 [Scortum barcoo]